MTVAAHDWERLQDLFHRANALPSESRARFLDQECASHTGLRAELESLFAVANELDSAFLQSPMMSDPAAYAGVALWAGQRFAERYEVVRKLGDGGMGQVWLAEQSHPIRRSVALKLIGAGMYDESVVQRFQSERQSLALMDHPYIAKVFDAGTTPQGQPYFVMEYVPGLPITEYCDRKGLSIKERLEIFIHVCEGVQHAHQKAVIHRDLKPANILVIEIDGKPVPRIIDFGLAKPKLAAGSDETQLTRFGHLLGTPGYMSPEQADPSTQDIDTRTDVYSLGVVLYVLLSGLQPFATSGRQRVPLDQWLRRLREDDPPQPSDKLRFDRENSDCTARLRDNEPKQLIRQLRGDLDCIALKTIDRDRERRYRSPNELAADLRRYLNHEPVLARPVGALEQASKFWRRHRLASSLTAVVLLLALFASGAGVLAMKKSRLAEHEVALTVEGQGRMLVEIAQRSLTAGDLSGAFRIILEVLTEPKFSSMPPSLALNIFLRVLASDRQLAVLAGHESFVESAAYSPDGTQIVTASYDRTARTWDARTGFPLRILSGHAGALSSAAYSPDGQRIVTASDDNTARIWDARSGKQLGVLTGHTDTVSSAIFSPDGTRILTASEDGTARIWDSRTGSPLAILSGHTGAVYTALYSPDGMSIISASADNTARIWDSHSGRQLRVLSGHDSAVMSAAFSPDGGRIVTASWDKTARVWDRRTGATLLVFSRLNAGVVCAAFSPDGNQIVTSADQDNNVHVWDAHSGVELSVLSGHHGWISSVVFSPDGGRILTASMDHTARIWDAKPRSPQQVFTGHEGIVKNATFSPDGTRVATASFDGTARIWDVRSGAQVMLLSGHTGKVHSAVYSPDGTHIVTASNDKTARIWDARTGAQVTVLSGHEDRVLKAGYSPDGTRIVTASIDKTARIWDAHTGAETARLSGHTDNVLSAVYSPDGQRIVTGSNDGTARIWDARTGAQIQVLTGHDGGVVTAAFSPDGTHIVTASTDATARVWDARTGTMLATLSGHTDALFSAAFSPDARLIVTASTDQTATIWDAVTAVPLLILDSQRGPVRSATFSPDGKQIVTASEDKAQLWNADVKDDIPTQVAWASAAEIDLVTDAEAREFGLAVLATSRPQASDGTACDRAAGAAYDPDRRSEGVLAPQLIMGNNGHLVCADEANEPLAPVRAKYQLGRQLRARGELAAAHRLFEIAATRGYRAARIDLADLLLDSGSTFADRSRASELYEQAWRSGVAIAAFKLGKLYEQQTASGRARSAAWQWYQRGADAREPNSLARFAEWQEQNAIAADTQSLRDDHLLQALGFYAAATARAHEENWPDEAWEHWRYRRASIARLLRADGMMREAGYTYRSNVSVANDSGLGIVRVH